MKLKKVRKNRYKQIDFQNAYNNQENAKGYDKKNKTQKSTVFDIVLLVAIIIIVYFIIYKLILIFIEIKIVNQNTELAKQRNDMTPSIINLHTIRINEYSTNSQKLLQSPVSTSQFSKQKILNSQPFYSNDDNFKLQNTISSNLESDGKLQNQQIVDNVLQKSKKEKEEVLLKQKMELLQKIKQNILQQEKLKLAENQAQMQNTNHERPDQQKNPIMIKENFDQLVSQHQKKKTERKVYTGQNRQDLSKFIGAPAKPLGFQVNKAGIGVQIIKQAIRFVDLKNKPKDDPLADQQRAYYEQKYKISQYQNQLPVCIVVPSYNNVQNDRYIGNINSILQQEYQNYHIVFIDDASPDNTSQKLKEYLSKKNLPEGRIKIIRNQQQLFAMHNLRRAALQFCKPQDIYIIVDGDDELLGRQVLALYNAIFQSKKAYFVYTNFITTFGNLGYSRPFPPSIKKDNRYRKHTYVTSHLRAYYTKLFQLIKQEDLRDDEGKYFKAANDVAICMPILQMSHERVEYIPQITYYYNGVTGMNNHKIRLNEQKNNNKIIRKRQNYFPLPDLFNQQTRKTITN